VTLREVRVTHGHLNLFVTHELGHSREQHAGHHHQARGEGVPQVVPGEALEAGSHGRIIEPVPRAL